MFQNSYKKQNWINIFDPFDQYPSPLNRKSTCSENPQDDKDFQSEAWIQFKGIKIAQMQKEQIQNQIKRQKKYIKSININKVTKQLKFEMTDDGSQSWLKHDHIGLPLRIFCDLQHPYDVSFSLNPNPQEKVINDQFPKTQIKWFSIDQQLKRPILQQTKFGQILFKADYMMKILTLGLKEKGQKFKYPQDLIDIFTIDFDLSKQKEISRFFLKVNENSNNKIIKLSEDEKFYKLKLQNPIIQVQARNVNIKNGKIVDTPVQDLKSRCYILAQRFSKYYDVIADQYSIFNQLKGAIIGLALAKWFQKQRIYIKKNFIDQICHQEFIKNYQKTLPFIEGKLTFQKYNGSKLQTLTCTSYRIGGFDGRLADSLFQTSKIQSQQNSSLFRSLSNYQKNKILASLNSNFVEEFIKSSIFKGEKQQKELNQKEMNLKKQREMIEKFQISNPSLYKKKLSVPNYPGGNSGVTIGIGYDLGQCNTQDFQKYWKNKLPNDQYNLLKKSIGLKGDKAKKFMQDNESQLKKIVISFDTAKETFNDVIQVYEKKTQKLYPGLREKHPNTFNSLVSLYYNRGFSTTGKTQEEKQRRKQMKQIYDVLTGKSQTSQSIPKFVSNQLKKMCRLWKGKKINGLIDRREEQAENCLLDEK